LLCQSLSFNYSGVPRALHSFPTRRSSDLFDPLVRAVPSHCLLRTGAFPRRMACVSPGFPRAWRLGPFAGRADVVEGTKDGSHGRSEEHTSELQSQSNLVCRLLLEKKKKHHRQNPATTSILRMIVTISPYGLMCALLGANRAPLAWATALTLSY